MYEPRVSDAEINDYLADAEVKIVACDSTYLLASMSLRDLRDARAEIATLRAKLMDVDAALGQAGVVTEAIVKAGCVALCEFEKRPPFATGDFFDCGQTKDEPAWKTKISKVEAILRAALEVALNTRKEG